MNSAWNKVWSECANDFPGFAEENIGAIRNDRVNLCHRADFNEVDDDVQDLLESHTESLSNDELIELDRHLRRQKKRETRKKNLCVAWTSKLLENVSVVSKSSRNPEGIHAIPVTPADPATAGPSTSATNGSTAGPSSISSFFKPVKRADPTTAGPFTSASDSADDNVLSSSAHSAENE
ncbi:hypothetical protein E2C01_094691 [Portunus trituberculatus]|uniref:Uncharacterized protein n=1 Tax=Portunus trituberculatus TaxID=210409 RepID=A0A5B7JYB6_PORTR|nr:hypothetical protein [Portunus trituberculatus]